MPRASHSTAARNQKAPAITTNTSATSSRSNQRLRGSITVVAAAPGSRAPSAGCRRLGPVVDPPARAAAAALPPVAAAVLQQLSAGDQGVRVIHIAFGAMHRWAQRRRWASAKPTVNCGPWPASCSTVCPNRRPARWRCPPSRPPPERWQQGGELPQQHCSTNPWRFSQGCGWCCCSSSSPLAPGFHRCGGQFAHQGRLEIVLSQPSGQLFQ